MPSTYITYKKPNYLGTALQSVGLVAEIKSRSRVISDRALINRRAVASVIHGTRVRLVRINSSVFLMAELNDDLPSGVEHYCYAYVVAADIHDGSVILDPEKI